VSIYPRKIKERSEAPVRSGRADGENASGKDASFICGSFVRFSLQIDSISKSVRVAGFETNGCGFMIAAADVLSDFTAHRQLADLHGLNESGLRTILTNSLGLFEENRQQCATCCITGLRAAFADYRTRQVEEFRGEKALVCTCFGITEETMENKIEVKSLRTVDEVTRECNAGGGCGSCRMLIQEMLDFRQNQLG